MNENELVENIVKILDNKKATNIKVINLNGISTLADFFVVASGRSSTQVKALIDYLDEDMEKLGVNMLRQEGKQEGKWAVADYGDVIVHIFHDEVRQAYQFDELWDNGDNIKILNI